ncbi:COX15/CtaA family protein [Parafilimonas sp.]|uniref:COX15/CtaA family protein n=1 Tax=Parafilimonas sp. TaxID=1969739 RepID=UPI0039E59E55
MNAYLNYTRLVLIFVFLVILAGGVVRTTQSGMGCPDWPHCYGRLMPPFSSKDLPADYKKYLDKQDIDMKYNPAHAWVEYINRLITGILGILIVIHVSWSFKKFFSSKQSIFWLSCLFLAGTVFEAWLGKLVVDTNLAVVKITLHMLAALFLAVIPALILHRLNNDKVVHDKNLLILTRITLIVLLLQIIIGTDVREQVDEVSKALNYQQRETWLSQLNAVFDVHKIVAIITSLLVILIFWRSLSHASLQKIALFLLLIVLLVAAAGFLLVALNIPAFIQPVHLLLSSVLFVSLFAFQLNLKS